MMEAIETRTPNVERGWEVISQMSIELEYFRTVTLGGEDEDELFTEIFGRERGDWMMTKDWFEDFGGVFYNMDDTNTVALLGWVADHTDARFLLDLEFPDVPNWRQLLEDGMRKKNMRMEGGGDLGLNDFRSFLPQFSHLTKWDVYPVDFIWIRKFILYALNHSINDNDYQGEKYGNWENWMAYFQWLPLGRQFDHCRMLVKYN